MTVKVDREVRENFEEFVKAEKGRKYGEMGRMAERALAEYMDNDRLARIDSRLDEIQAHLESEKEESKNTHPGKSVRDREESIISSVIHEEKVQVHRRELEKAIKEHNLTAGKTIKKYIKNVTERDVFSHGNAPALWDVEHEHAEDYY